MKQTIDYYSPAEDFLTEYKLHRILFNQGIIDETVQHREGDFRLEDGRLIEVKTDARCFASVNPTGNIPVEMDHPKHKGRQGWYHHCIENGVSIVLFCCCDDEECMHAVRYISIPMDGLKEFVGAKMQDADYMREHTRYTKDGTGNLCVPYQEILTISGTRQLIPLDRIERDGKHITMCPGKHERTALAYDQATI